ncbi:hypothetical protein [Natrialbaceae archaeon AArc-T1-2]|uniref:hypothetical protein n=1 Tax=Natrialbaceae archaeon AArc-T1-2 TaxID=3053904 RepID=UPI00255B2E98|nr:hypothetical protein [Natrialbaceae archaeon AArc-T1-2]WIV67475.1 hypothetical protein QQ977_01730 [Natrialbaceae archaeon AArc-T1-2]
MVETHKPELEGETLQYRDDAWELTGTIEIKRNGELIAAEARKTDRVRGETGRLAFTVANGASSINPGNPENFVAEIEPQNTGYALIASRDHTTDRYELNSMQYG